MPKLIVENLPADVFQCLQERAAAKQHSVTDEVVQVLRHAVADDLARKQTPSDFTRRAGYVFLAGVAVLVVVVSLWLLSGGTRRDLLPHENVEFAAGFYNEEQFKDSRWRWMGEEGVVQLRNTKEPMVLKI